MFTGIIEDKGRIIKIINGRPARISIQSSLEVKLGDSVAIQGICLTVTDVAKNEFVVEAMKQTKGITTLAQWQTGNYVNLERALKLGEHIGGHILLGHIDEVGKLIRTACNNYYFQISPANSKYLLPKGSVGIDGVSLTISSVSRNIFSISLIPYTFKNTTLGNLKIGLFVNVEYDYLVKILIGKVTC